MGNQTIGAAAVDVFTSNPSRAGVTMRNESAGGQVIGFSFRKPQGLTMTNRDYVLRPQEEKNFYYDLDGEDIRNSISAVADGAGAVLVKAETSYRSAV